MEFQAPYLLFFADIDDPHYAKTGLGLAHWAPERCLAQFRLTDRTVDAGLPDMTPAEAVAAGARSLVVGVANTGGYIGDGWVTSLVEALEAGLDLVSGLHTRLGEVPAIAEAAERTGRRLFDVRHATGGFRTASGQPRTGHRILTVGTDCAIGKKYTALTIANELAARGIPADFRATGQTGILISGRGVAVDAVKADFIAGAAEWLAPANDPDHWDVIEGQGSIYHPAYAGVTVGLVHGSQAEVLVLCHDPSRRHIDGFPRYGYPTLAQAMEDYLRLARLTSPDVRFGGIALNTSRMDEEAAGRVLRETEAEHGLPTFDPIRTGVARFVDALVGAAVPTSQP